MQVQPCIIGQAREPSVLRSPTVSDQFAAPSRSQFAKLPGFGDRARTPKIYAKVATRRNANGRGEQPGGVHLLDHDAAALAALTASLRVPDGAVPRARVREPIHKYQHGDACDDLKAQLMYTDQKAIIVGRKSKHALVRLVYELLTSELSLVAGLTISSGRKCRSSCIHEDNDTNSLSRLLSGPCKLCLRQRGDWISAVHHNIARRG